MSILSAPHYHNEEAAYAYVEARLWPNGPICPHCGGYERISKMGGKSTRIGTYKCYQCRKPFTVKIGTIFEASHVPMRHWLQAIYLMAASKKGISSNQIHRTLGCTLKTAWFITHRLREAMKDGSLDPFGGEGRFVEADETAIGGKERNKHLSKRNAKVIGMVGKSIAFTLVERGGRARSFHVANVSGATLRPIIAKHVLQSSTLMTDEAGQYRPIGRDFARHGVVNHGIEEYVRGDTHSNTVEAFFSILKRGITGCYFHVSEAHLHRYLAEFDFRHSNRVALGVHDAERADIMLSGVVGKRLTYRTTGSYA